jgi:pimeloyl-ACP methyl ester carboxylesterase
MVPRIAVTLRGLIAVIGLALVGAAASAADTPALQRVEINGSEFHYVQQGRGETIVFLHGGFGDYRAWLGRFPGFADRYRVVCYSRRHHFPNRNPIVANNHSAHGEADDLEALLQTLDIESAHFVGSSYGAFTALMFALKHPERVRSLTLAEPPVHELVKTMPGRTAIYDEFMQGSWEPARKAFLEGDRPRAVELLSLGISNVASSHIAPARLAAMMENASAMEALTRSSDPFPAIDRAALARLKMPVLLIAGEHTTLIHRLVNDELARFMTKAKSVTIPNAGHASAQENPAAFDAALNAFLAGKSTNSMRR